MNLDEIVTYDDLNNYIMNIGFETLTDNDINALCKKIKCIKQRRIELIERKNLSSTIKEAFIMAETSIACNKIYSLHNCTEERRLMNNDRIRESQEKVRNKDVINHIKTMHQVFLKK